MEVSEVLNTLDRFRYIWWIRRCLLSKYIHSFRCTVSVHCRIDISTGFPLLLFFRIIFSWIAIHYYYVSLSWSFFFSEWKCIPQLFCSCKIVLKKYPSYDIKYNFIYGFKMKAVGDQSFTNFYVWGHNVWQRCGIYEHASIIDILDIYELLRDFLIILLLIEDISHRMRI